MMTNARLNERFGSNGGLVSSEPLRVFSTFVARGNLCVPPPAPSCLHIILSKRFPKNKGKHRNMNDFPYSRFPPR